MKKRITALLLAVMMTFNMEGIADAAGVSVPQTTDQAQTTAGQEAVQQTEPAQEQTIDQEGNTSVTENPCRNLYFSVDSLTLLAGETDDSVVLSAEAELPEEEMTGTITLVSSDPAIAAVENGASDIQIDESEGTNEPADGAVKPGPVRITAGSSSGTAVITASTTGADGADLTASFTVTVRAPKKVTITALEQTAYNKARLTFQPGTTEDADGYVVQQKKSSDTSWGDAAEIKADGTFQYTASSLVCGTKYSFRVRSYLNRADGTRMYGSVSSTRSITTRPEQTTITAVTSTAYNKLKLTWKKVSGASGYAIYRSTSKTVTYKKIGTITSGSKLNYTDSSKITSGVRYYYKIKAYRTVEKKNIYGPSSDARSGKAVPTAAVLASVKSSSYNKLTVTWKKVAGASGYQIYYAASKNGTYKRARTVTGGKTLSGTISGLSTGRKYYVKVRAFRTVNKTRVYGTFSVCKTGTPVCAKPTGVRAVSVNSNKITISWKKVSGAQYYVVSRSSSKNGTYKVVKKKCTSLSYTNSSLVSGNKYYYKVYAVRGASKGTTSAVVAARAKSLTVARSSISIHKGEVSQLIITASPVASVKWSSSNRGVATVSGTGLVTAVGLGSAVITVRANGFTKTIKVKVKNRLDGIDVSKWQGDINWPTVASSGISFAMIRVWHTANTPADSKDTYFEQNYNGARAAGIKVGCYAYSTANSVEAAVAEAQNVVGILGGRPMDYPVVMDMESSNALSLTNAQRTDMIFAFKSVIEGAGYKFALYANTYWLDHYIDNSRLNGVDVWVARYKADTTTGYEYQGGGNVVMWQHSNTGSVNGINGAVDLDYGYKAY